MNASTGFFAHSLFFTAGMAGRCTGRNAQKLRASSSTTGAPCRGRHFQAAKVDRVDQRAGFWLAGNGGGLATFATFQNRFAAGEFELPLHLRLAAMAREAVRAQDGKDLLLEEGDVCFGELCGLVGLRC
jgi:hypothetical protein